MKTDTEKHTMALRRAIRDVCKSVGVHDGVGPPMAYFNVLKNANEPGKRFEYVTFDMGGAKAEGAMTKGAAEWDEVLNRAVAMFKAWVQEKRTLVWRVEPEAGRNTYGNWAVYWRCVQLDDDAKIICVDWVL